MAKKGGGKKSGRSGAKKRPAMKFSIGRQSVGPGPGMANRAARLARMMGGRRGGK